MLKIQNYGGDFPKAKRPGRAMSEESVKLLDALLSGKVKKTIVDDPETAKKLEYRIRALAQSANLSSHVAIRQDDGKFAIIFEGVPKG